MFLIKGTNRIHKELFIIILLSVDMKEEALLYIFRGANNTELVNLGIEQFNTISILQGDSLEILTKKHHLLDWFSSTKFPATLPAIVSVEFKDDAIEDFFKQGTKVKFLKFAYGFAGQYVYAVDSLKDVKQIVKDTHEKDIYTQPGQTMRKWILQDMLEDVALFDGYKFHLRVWLVVVVRDNHVSVYISNYHTYEFAKKRYDVKQLKEKDVWDTHKYQNTRTALFPMELPDHWSAADGAKAMENIKSSFKTIYEQQHMFKASYKLKNGFQIFGADVLVDSKQNPYILEINIRPVLYNTFDSMIPEYFHLAMGGAPLKLFSTLYGTSEGRTTPFIKPLESFYKTIYPSTSALNAAIEKTFFIPFDNDSCRGYLLYQNMTRKKIHRTTKKKHRTSLLK
jgi:hypothetical protein